MSKRWPFNLVNHWIRNIVLLLYFIGWKNWSHQKTLYASYLFFSEFLIFITIAQSKQLFIRHILIFFLNFTIVTSITHHILFNGKMLNFRIYSGGYKFTNFFDLKTSCDLVISIISSLCTLSAKSTSDSIHLSQLHSFNNTLMCSFIQSL